MAFHLEFFGWSGHAAKFGQNASAKSKMKQELHMIFDGSMALIFLKRNTASKPIAFLQNLLANPKLEPGPVGLIVGIMKITWDRLACHTSRIK